MEFLRLLRPIGIWFGAKWAGDALQKISDEYANKEKKLEQIVVQIARHLENDAGFINKVDQLAAVSPDDKSLVKGIMQMPEVRTRLKNYDNDPDLSMAEIANGLEITLLAAVKNK